MYSGPLTQPDHVWDHVKSELGHIKVILELETGVKANLMSNVPGH